MKIPKNEIDRHILYRDVSDACLRSRDDRITDYVRREAYYLNGSESGQPPATFNKIYPSIQNLVAFLFSADSTRYTVDLDAEVPRGEIEKIPPVAKYINDRWWQSDSDAVAAQCAEWALVYNSMLMKSLWVHGQFHAYAVRPHDFGVYQEDVTTVDDQEAVVHVYAMPMPALERMLEGHPRKDQIMKQVQPKAGRDEQPDRVSQLILTASAPITPSNPNMVGALASNALRSSPNYEPTLPDDMVEMRELWVWNDEESDYQVVTMASNVTVFDRLAGDDKQGKQLFVKGENPFTLFCPSPKYNYFFGTSDVERVSLLQDLLTKRNEEFDNLLEKQVKPPGFGRGYTDEQMLALTVIGGIANSSDPTADYKQLIPEIPQHLLTAFEMVNDGFADSLALHNILQGKGEPGVRGRGHAQELARISSARIKRKAMTVEDSLEKVGSLMLKLMAQNDDTVLYTDSGEKFVLAQFPKECAVRVDAHSNSPIFAEDNENRANTMLEAKIIDGESYIDLTKPPMAEVLKKRYKDLQKKKEAEILLQAQQKQGESNG